MSFLSNLDSLEELDLQKVPISMFGLNQMHIERFAHLRRLNIGNTAIDGHDLAQVPNVLLQLKYLRMNDMHHASEVLAVLQHSTNIESLCLESTWLTDSDMDYLSRMQSLRELIVMQNRLTNRGLAKLTALKHLANLWIAGCPITLSAVPILASFNDLQAIQLPSAFRGHESELRAGLPKKCQFQIAGYKKEDD
jgi:Leucine-rich repeat (LRR) protein